MENELPTTSIPRRKKLETKGCCFFCLTVTEFKAETDGSNHSSVTGNNKETVHLKSLQRYLQLKTKRGDDDGRKIDEIEADLCKSCGRIFNNFSKLFTSLEKIQIEIQYWLERIQQQISEASKKPELVQVYSKRMTSDAKSLAQLVFVDNFRKEIAKKSSKRKWSLEPIVELSRLEKAEIEKYSRKKKNDTGRSFPEDQATSEDNYSLLWDDDGPDNSEDNLPSPLSAQPLDGHGDDKIIIKQDILSNAERCHKNENRRHKCDKCKSFYNSKEALMVHFKECDGNKRLPRLKAGSYSFLDVNTKKFNCRICKKAFTRKGAANTHYHSVHLRTEYKCERCNAVLSNRNCLYRHRKMCGRKSQGQLVNNMERHKNTNTVHLKQNNFGCNLCQKIFPDLITLKEHKNKIHFSIFYNCKFCSKRFENESSLSEHQAKCVESVKLEPEIDILPH